MTLFESVRVCAYAMRHWTARERRSPGPDRSPEPRRPTRMPRRPAVAMVRDCKNPSAFLESAAPSALAIRVGRAAGRQNVATPAGPRVAKKGRGRSESRNHHSHHNIGPRH